MPNNYCGLSDAELAEVRQRHRHYIPVRIDEHTTIFIDPNRDAEEAKKKFIKELKCWRLKHYNDE